MTLSSLFPRPILSPYRLAHNLEAFSPPLSLLGPQREAISFHQPQTLRNTSRPSRQPIRLLRHRRVYLALSLNLRFACAALVFGDGVEYLWNVLAAAPPAGAGACWTGAADAHWEGGK